MVLEATIICLDNSEWMRNGDYFPSRMEAQIDAINVVMNWKLQSNPENTVGVLKMAKGPEVLVTPGPDVGKVLSALHSVKIQGKVDIMTSIQVAQLALKHRQNKNQHQRMVLFIGSPAQADTAALTKLGQALKKNNVAVDVVSFGEVDENHEKLEAFVKAVNSNDNSNLVEVAPGTRTLTEAIRASPLSGRAPAAAGGEGGGGEGGEDFFGVDPNEDYELAMAIRASLEEEKRRREREQGGGEAAAEGGAPAQEATAADSGMDVDDEEAMLAQAIALSMQAAGSQPAATAPETAPAQQETKQETTTAAAAAAPASEKEGAAGAGEITDPQFLNEILKSLPGVDPDDPQIQLILESMKAQQQQQGEKKEGEK